MKKSTYNFTGRQRIFWALLCAGLLTGISFFINYKTEAGNDNVQAHKSNYSLKSFSVGRRESAPAVNIGERTSVWLKLEQGKSLDTTFYGSDAAISSLRGNRAEPTAQVSADINADGFDDLVSGFRNADGGGLIALHRASKQAFQPEDEQVLADLRRGVFPATFEKDALIMDAPTAPDFIFAGRFSEGSTVDLVFASRGGRSVFVMNGDGRGGFGAAREIALDGEITALASDRLDASKTYTGLTVATRNGKSSTVSIFDGADELGKSAPRKFQIEGDVNSLILANPGGEAQGKDIFGLADGGVFTLRRAGNPNTSISKIELPFRTADIAVGEFIRDRQGKAEIAVLSEDGNVSYLTRGTLDTRPFTTEEVIALREQAGRGRNLPVNKPTTDDLSDNWTVGEEHQLGVYSLNGNSSRVLQKAYITGNETEDLLIADSNNSRLRILFKEPTRGENRTEFTGETKIQNVDLAQSPAAVLPMRLNVMGQQGFVVFGKDSLEPIPVMFAPNVTFVVTKTADTNDAICNADCSVREAVQHANATAGADMITFGLNGTHTLTLAGINEDLAGTGDLDIREAKTIVGNGAASTIIEAGTNTTNGIDKVMSINPTFSSAFATSLTGFTVRHGRNQSTFVSGVGFGGGFDWESSTTGTLTISGLTVTLNSTQDGDGGGITATSFPTAGSSAFISLTNSTISSNDPDRASATASPIGGGLFVGVSTTYRLTNTVVTMNNVTESFMQGQGGGIYAFSPASSAGKSFLTGSTFTSNSAPSDGGGIYSLQALDINTPTIISNNSSGRSGGGLFINHTNGTTVMSEATLVGNSATLNGGAIYHGVSTTSNILNMSFSRIVGNTAGTSSGLISAGGTSNIENNWWGCNTGPSAAPCDTVSAITGGVVDFDPWLQLRLTASPNTTPVVGESRSLTASFLLNSAGGAVAASNLDALIGLPVTWSASGGTISGQQTTIQASGTATATFTATAASPPNRTATAQVDNGPATVNFVVGKANTALSGLMDSPDPSVTGQPYTVSFTLSVVAPGAGTPMGTVTVTDGTGGMCMATLPSTSCMLTSTSAGAKTLTFTYSGDANFNGTMLTTGHTVNKADTTSTITGESADPTAQGEVFTVFYTVTVNSPGAGTPTGNVTVSDGINSCVGTVAAGQCSLFLNTTGVRTLTATYASDANFNGSVSPGVPHTVLPIVAASVSVSGRIQTQTGRGIPKAQITLTDQNGEVVTAISNGFGYYRFEGIQVGETYFFHVRHKEYQFAPQAVTINDDVTDLNFTALE